MSVSFNMKEIYEIDLPRYSDSSLLACLNQSRTNCANRQRLPNQLIPLPTYLLSKPAFHLNHKLATSLEFQSADSMRLTNCKLDLRLSPARRRECFRSIAALPARPQSRPCKRLPQHRILSLSRKKRKKERRSSVA